MMRASPLNLLPAHRAGTMQEKGDVEVGGKTHTIASSTQPSQASSAANVWGGGR